MPSTLRHRLAIVAAIVAAGCEGNRPPPSDGPVVPPRATAQAALVTALEGWRNGKGPMQAGNPQVGLVDSDRIDGRRLLGFEVLGPIELGVGRGFSVRLELAAVEPEGEPQEQVVRFVVFGIDPLWVFRLEDFERISHWEHKMDPESEDPGA